MAGNLAYRNLPRRPYSCFNASTFRQLWHYLVHYLVALTFRHEYATIIACLAFWPSLADHRSYLGLYLVQEMAAFSLHWSKRNMRIRMRRAPNLCSSDYRRSSRLCVSHHFRISTVTLIDLASAYIRNKGSRRIDVF